MALQRCVWACLANSPGAASAEYNACVAEFCSEEEFGGANAGAGGKATPADTGLAQSPRPATRPTDPGQAAPETASAAPAMPLAAAVPGAGWTHGPGSDGTGMFAGIMDADRGSRLDWLCAKGYPSVLALSPYAGTGEVVFVVDGRPRPVTLTVKGVVGFTPITLSDPLFLHLASGQTVDVQGADGALLGQFAMAGAPLAIGQAEGRCR
ncbi:MAG: hypothetical protein R3D90_06645 [Paracoccaceae bacterium]